MWFKSDSIGEFWCWIDEKAMLKFLPKLCLLLLLVLPAAVVVQSSGIFANAQQAVEDEVEGEEDDDTTVETDEGSDEAGIVGQDKEEGEDDEAEEQLLKPSPNADTTVLFIKPENAYELPAGKLVKLIVGFTNNGDKEFLIETMDGSFRYPQDYSFHIQNFTTFPFGRVVEPGRQASFVYQFMPSEMFSSRPFGLTFNLNYKDSSNQYYQDAVFNETVTIIEPDEGLDGETFFLYVFLAACGVLLLVVGQQLLASFGKKKGGSAKTVIETGTANHAGVDYDWLPETTLNEINKSPKRSPRQSPRQRAAKRNSGSDE